MHVRRAKRGLRQVLPGAGGVVVEGEDTDGRRQARLQFLKYRQAARADRAPRFRTKEKRKRAPGHGSRL